MVVAYFPKSKPINTAFAFSFTRDHRFRVELYVDLLDKQKNKRVFDALEADKEKYEDILGDISWERIDNKRASRIAIYHDGHILDNNAKLQQLRKWAVQTMEKFYDTFADDAGKIIMQELEKAE